MRLHFVRWRFLWYALSLAVILPGLVSLFLRGLNLGIDFTGGSLIEVEFHRPVEIAEVRQVMASFGLQDALIQKSGTSVFLIRTRPLEEKQSQEVVKALEQKIGPLTLLRSEKVGPVIGKELTRKAFLASGLSLVILLIYLAIRFDFKQGVAAIIGLVHDVLVVLGIFSIFQLEVDSSFVAAVLTTLGYSLHDTVIVFDRIRENIKIRKLSEPLADVINLSIWQTLTRSINTVMTVLFVLVALYFLGGSTLRNFVLALIIGVISGAYSSVCDASPIWYDLKRWEEKRRAKALKARRA
ncbi:protein-export membrane protein SecF [Ammonifex degensii KC4]|uniref:Protein-export membrane protein SecF n=1 Tax=Ammonifex degensii (strain DSM 10501 / KC4) TaxID=429009 RepID=C9R7V2_AMMDK|nr:protein translocase subunit SecF [Ammonifex degensii]ACX52381.1 protein-export membrane protein SecF [Ammonifex degensii KC4]